MLLLSLLVTRLWIIHLPYFCFKYEEGLDSTYILPDAAGNAFCVVLDSNLGLDNGYVAPGFVGLLLVIEGKFWEVAVVRYGGFLSCHLPFIFSCLLSLWWWISYMKCHVCSHCLYGSLLCLFTCPQRYLTFFFRHMAIVPVFHDKYLLNKGPLAWLLNNTFSYISYYLTGVSRMKCDVV